MTLLEPPPLASVLTDLPGGLRLALHGELSAVTAPALEALLHSLREGGEARIVLDVRDASVVVPVDRLLARWEMAAGFAPGTYECDLTSSTPRITSARSGKKSR